MVSIFVVKEKDSKLVQSCCSVALNTKETLTYENEQTHLHS